MNTQVRRLATTAVTALVLMMALGASQACVAADDASTSGAQAAALQKQAASQEADIDKACQKVPPNARPLCREQQLRAVQRLRNQAARAH
jgi:hypothetical protein